MTKRQRAEPQLIVLFDEDGQSWGEIRKTLPDGGRSVVVELESMGFRASSWCVALVRTKLALVRVGTKGAAWERFDPAQRVQLWLPGDLDVEAGTIVQVEIAEP